MKWKFTPRKSYNGFYFSAKEILISNAYRNFSVHASGQNSLLSPKDSARCKDGFRGISRNCDAEHLFYAFP